MKKDVVVVEEVREKVRKGEVREEVCAVACGATSFTPGGGRVGGCCQGWWFRRLPRGVHRSPRVCG